jgi:hypothetical protein
MKNIAYAFQIRMDYPQSMKKRNSAHDVDHLQYIIYRRFGIIMTSTYITPAVFHWIGFQELRDGPILHPHTRQRRSCPRDTINDTSSERDNVAMFNLAP